MAVDYTPKPGTPLLSPLRYPGSKRRLAGYLRDVLRVNKLHPELFIEPFAGGASVALQLLCDRVVDEIGLADLDPLLSAFWHCVFNDTDWLVDAVSTAEVSLAEWERLKWFQPRSVRERAYKCIFLNRTSFSGILSPSAGPIGGRKQESAYSIDCRFPKDTIIRRIRQAASLGARVRFVWGCDWCECLARTRGMCGDLKPDDVFYYLDPPFYYKAKKLYTHYFRPSDHTDLHDALVQLQHPWLLSYDAAEPMERLYSSNGTRPKRVAMLYSAAGRSGLTTAEELIVTNLSKLPTGSHTWRRGPAS